MEKEIGNATPGSSSSCRSKTKDAVVFDDDTAEDSTTTESIKFDSNLIVAANNSHSSDPALVANNTLGGSQSWVTTWGNDSPLLSASTSMDTTEGGAFSSRDSSEETASAQHYSIATENIIIDTIDSLSDDNAQIKQSASSVASNDDEIFLLYQEQNINNNDFRVPLFLDEFSGDHQNYYHNSGGKIITHPLNLREQDLDEQIWSNVIPRPVTPDDIIQKAIDVHHDTTVNNYQGIQHEHGKILDLEHHDLFIIPSDTDTAHHNQSPMGVCLNDDRLQPTSIIGDDQNQRRMNLIMNLQQTDPKMTSDTWWSDYGIDSHINSRATSTQLTFEEQAYINNLMGMTNNYNASSSAVLPSSSSNNQRKKKFLALLFGRRRSCIGSSYSYGKVTTENNEEIIGLPEVLENGSGDEIMQSLSSPIPGFELDNNASPTIAFSHGEIMAEHDEDIECEMTMMMLEDNIPPVTTDDDDKVYIDRYCNASTPTMSNVKSTVTIQTTTLFTSSDGTPTDNGSCGFGCSASSRTEVDIPETTTQQKISALTTSPVKSIPNYAHKEIVHRNVSSSCGAPTSTMPSTSTTAITPPKLLNTGSIRKLFGVRNRSTSHGNGGKVKTSRSFGVVGVLNRNGLKIKRVAGFRSTTVDTTSMEGNNDNEGDKKCVASSDECSVDESNYWKSILDASTNKTYYYNKKTKAVSWVKPSGYEMTKADKIASVVDEKTTGSMDQTDPDDDARSQESAKDDCAAGAVEKSELLFAKYWRATLDIPTGMTYYFNERTNMTTWTKPEGFKEKESSFDEENTEEKESSSGIHPLFNDAIIAPKTMTDGDCDVANGQVRIAVEGEQSSSLFTYLENEIAKIDSPENDNSTEASMPTSHVEVSGNISTTNGISSPTITVFGNIETIVVPEDLAIAEENDLVESEPDREVHDVNAEITPPTEVANVMSMFRELVSIDYLDKMSIDSDCSLPSTSLQQDDLAHTSAHSTSSSPRSSVKKRRLSCFRGRAPVIDRSSTEANDMEHRVSEVSTRESEDGLTKTSEFDTVDIIEVRLGANRRIDQMNCEDHRVVQASHDANSSTAPLNAIQCTSEEWERLIEHDDSIPQNTLRVRHTGDIELHRDCSNFFDVNINTTHWNGRIVGLRLPSNIDTAADTTAKPTESRVDPSNFYVGVKERNETTTLGAEWWNPWYENYDTSPDGGTHHVRHNDDVLPNSESLPIPQPFTIPPPTNILFNIYLFNQNDPSKQAIKIQTRCDGCDDTFKTLQRLQLSIQAKLYGEATTRQAKNDDGKTKSNRVEKNSSNTFLWRKKLTDVSVSAVHPTQNEDSTEFLEELRHAMTTGICNLFCVNREHQLAESKKNIQNDCYMNNVEGYERVQNAHSIATEELLRRATKEEYGKYAISLPIVPSNNSNALWIPLLLDSCPPTIISVSSSVSFREARIFVRRRIIVDVSMIYATRAQITWFANGEQVCANDSCYTPTLSDVGKTLTVVITPLGTNHDGRGCEEAYQFQRPVEAFPSFANMSIV